MMSDKRKNELLGLIHKYKKKVFVQENVLFNIVDQIQDFIEFAFLSEGKEVPKITLGDENEVHVNEETRTDHASHIFIKLKRRCYYNTPTEHNDKNTKLFQSEGVIHASYPTLHDYVYTKDSEKIPTYKGIYFSDNEFVITLKTKTIKEQFEMINTLERTLNVHGRKFAMWNIVASGIAKIEIEEKTDKDKLETAKIYFQVRVQEVVTQNKEFIIKAFKILFEDYDDIEEDVTYYEDHTFEETRKKVIESQKLFPKQDKKTTNHNYDDTFMWQP